MVSEKEKEINPRRFKVWESAVLKQAMYHSAGIKDKLQEICIREELPIDEIKPTLISSEMLYMIVDSYLEAYDLLLKEELIHTSPKITPTLH